MQAFYVLIKSHETAGPGLFTRSPLLCDFYDNFHITFTPDTKEPVLWKKTAAAYGCPTGVIRVTQESLCDAKLYSRYS